MQPARPSHRLQAYDLADCGEGREQVAVLFLLQQVLGSVVRFIHGFFIYKMSTLSVSCI